MLLRPESRNRSTEGLGGVVVGLAGALDTRFGISTESTGERVPMSEDIESGGGKPLPFTNYKDLRLRKPRSDWRVGGAEAWIANVLGLPVEAVRLVLPGKKRRARSDKTLGALRKDWSRP